LALLPFRFDFARSAMAVPLTGWFQLGRDLPAHGQAGAVIVADAPDQRPRAECDAAFAPISHALQEDTAQSEGSGGLAAGLGHEKVERFGVGHHGAACCRRSPGRVNDS
jgi:hypothetical protein